MVVGGWWLVVGGWWLMAAGWWLVAGGGWWLLAGGGCSLTLSLAGLICSPLLLLALLLAHRSLSLSLSPPSRQMARTQRLTRAPRHTPNSHPTIMRCTLRRAVRLVALALVGARPGPAPAPRTTSWPRMGFTARPSVPITTPATTVIPGCMQRLTVTVPVCDEMLVTNPFWEVNMRECSAKPKI